MPNLLLDRSKRFENQSFSTTKIIYLRLPLTKSNTGCVCMADIFEHEFSNTENVCSIACRPVNSPEEQGGGGGLGGLKTVLRNSGWAAPVGGRHRGPWGWVECTTRRHKSDTARERQFQFRVFTFEINGRSLGLQLNIGASGVPRIFRVGVVQ